MSQEGGVAPGRRRLHLLAAFCALGTGVGVTKYLADRSRPPAGNATPVDLGDLPAGRLRTVDWNGRTVGEVPRNLPRWQTAKVN